MLKAIPTKFRVGMRLMRPICAKILGHDGTLPRLGNRAFRVDLVSALAKRFNIRAENKAAWREFTSASGTSRYLVAMLNLIAIRGMADIDQAAPINLDL